MTEVPAFEGFPSISKATAIPNAFFALVLPRLTDAGALLAFLWTARVVQGRRGDARFATIDEIWAMPGARESFEQLGRGRESLIEGLAECVCAGALLVITTTGADGPGAMYLVNDPPSRRLVARFRAGEVSAGEGRAVIHDVRHEPRPGIFRLYEEHIGTITPLVGEKLLDAAETYPADWIEDAFREAVELNARSWRYVERILERWEKEGRRYETIGRDSPEDRRQRFLGGSAADGLPFD